MSWLCLAVAGYAAMAVQTQEFELHWMHSVERVQWHEHYRVEPPKLVLTENRVQGSGAGMEPDADAVLKQGWWVSQRHMAVPELTLPDSGFTNALQLCSGGQCAPLASWLPRDGADRNTPYQLWASSDSHCDDAG
ncbi:hypothetical protein WH50_22225 [Pokkaliibacter plantistimulans]|uniref:DUF1850 domain-containing protein n=1 Tax=Pokkaliibacter plantistimulans TaxID=1635171 RepID=A0ABX5LUM9_9GAMM|nr:DUF1850 domain-containing protein [Pokkaliibacter plantistimulans]PXF29198.1 hypothetical protein WH50_22225 [Pokkaliibacter plantistimulans]